MSQNNATNFRRMCTSAQCAGLRESRTEYPAAVGGGRAHCIEDGGSAQTPLSWTQRYEVARGQREGATTSEREHIKKLEQENAELRPANDILRTASAFFAQADLDRELKS